MRRSVYKLCVFSCLLLSCSSIEYSIENTKHPLVTLKTSRHSIKNVPVKATPLISLTNTNHVTRRNYILMHTFPPRYQRRKKSDVFDVNHYTNIEKHKRGFLTNLANLLKDADAMARAKGENELNSREIATDIEIKFPNLVAAVNRNKTSNSNYDNTDKVREAIIPKHEMNNTIVKPVHKEVVSHEVPERSMQVKPTSTLKKRIDNIPTSTLKKRIDNIPTSTLKKRIDNIPTSTVKKRIDNIKILSENISTLLNNGKKFAPIYAMYHGKLTPIGKIPESDLVDQLIPPGSFEFQHPHNNVPMLDQDKSIKDVSGSKRTLFNFEYDKANENNHLNKPPISKLASYLRSLDEPISTLDYPRKEEEKPILKNTHEVAKDVVVFPDGGDDAPSKAEIFNHVKGVVLDNGKFLSVKHNNYPRIGTTKETIDAPDEELQQKYLMAEEGNLAPVIKRKPDVADAPARDLADEVPKLSTSSILQDNSQKSVTLPVNFLREILRKTDSKISLDSLLGRSTPPKKSEPILETDSNNPDMASKGTDSNVSLAALLNKNPEPKSDPVKDEEEDPGTIEDFAAGGLKAHNEYRARHHDEALIWSDDIAAKAQKLAETLADKKTLEIAKDLEKEGYGENVAKVWATFKNAGEAAAKMWYSQSENYHFDDPHLDENTGQFAQVVWKSTKELGMGVAKSIDDVNNKYVYVTALYRPPGNVEAVLRENVLPTGNNTVDVYTTFFKRAGVILSNNIVKKHPRLFRDSE